MARRAGNVPTEGELKILRVLWRRGPSTVRQVNEALSQSRPTGYTTTLKLMQIMLDKRLVKRDESRRPQVYRPAVSQDQTRRRFVGDLLDRVFDGSARELVLQVLRGGDVSESELSRVEKLLNKLEGDRK